MRRKFNLVDAGRAAIAASLLAACSSTEAARAPADVRVTEMSPEVMDRIVSQVVERIQQRATTLPPSPQAIQIQGAAAAPRVVEWAPRSARTAPAPLAAVPLVTDEELKSARDGVALALDWLAQHQSEEGTWSASGFSSRCKLNQCAGRGEPTYDVGVSGLALLCFLGAGETMESGPHADTVKRGLKRLAELQDMEGCIGPRVSQHFMYNHAYGALALCEAYGLSKSAKLRTPAQQSVNFILRAQNPYLGWRYGVRDGDNDTSVTGLMVAVLRSAKNAGLDVDDGAFRGALSWFDKMTEPEFGRVGYQQRGGPPARTMEAVARFPADRSESLTAIATAARIFAGEDPARSETIRKGAALVAGKPPMWDGTGDAVDLYGWYWGTLAMSQTGGAPWEQWRARLVRALTAHQRREDGRDERGSWEPADPWSAEGGRIYATAMACLASQIATRAGR